MPACVPPSFWNLAFVSGFWGLRFQIPTKALPLDPAGDFRPPDLLFGPLSEIPGYALVMTYSYRTSITSEIYVRQICYTHNKCTSAYDCSTCA